MRLGFVEQVICLFASMSFLQALFNRNVVIYAIKDNPIPSRFFPKHYTKVPHFIKYFFKLKSREIPKYLYVEALLSLFYILLFPMNIIISLCSGCSDNVVGILVMVQCIIGLINQVVFVSFYSFYKNELRKESKRKKRKKR